MITQINERDLISMKLLHFFITKKNYTPIIVQGVENEIWLENLEADYKVIRIVNNYIHNDEQLDFDVFKTKRMIKKIKRKTFTFKIKTLSILTDVGENVSKDKTYDDVDIIFKEVFPDMKNNMQYSEEGFQLFLKITEDINLKNRRDAVETDRILEPKKPVVTYIILGLITVIFLLGMVFDPNEIIYYFANNRLFVREGEIYRLITCAFIHVDVVHFLSNAYSLFIVGNMVEGFYGKKKFGIIYLVSAICASLLSISMSDGFSIGASGAIFGLLGSLLYFGYHYRVYFGNVLLNRIIPIVILNLGIGFIVPGIDNFAHIGGLVGGFLISKALGINSKDKKSDKVNGIILLVMFMAFLVFLGIMKG